MSSLLEQRMLAAHQQGRRDFLDGKSELAPVFLTIDERDAYRAGYRGEAKRQKSKIIKSPDSAH